MQSTENEIKISASALADACMLLPSLAATHNFLAGGMETSTF